MPNTKFDSKSFNPQAFGHYVNRIPNPNKTELAKSGAVGSNEQARNALATQTGSLYSRIPYFGRISGETSQNNTGADDINSTSTTTYEQGFVVASRMDAWTEKSFSKNITAGVDFMDNVAAQISEYKMEVKQASRRARVLARWFTNVPYTIKALISKLQNLCGESNFSISTDYEFYKITITVDLELFGQVDELDYIIESMMPCNIVTITTNKIPCNIKGNAFVGGGLCFVHNFTVSNDFNEQYNASGNAFIGSRSQFTTHFFITNDVQEAIAPNGVANQGGVAVNTAFVTISDNFNETYDINGLNSAGSGVALSEIIGANT